MPDGVAGVEVISVVRRRRRWTSEQKLALVAEVEQSGGSLAGVADRHGVSRSLLFEWRRQLHDDAMPGITRTPVPAPNFAPVRVIEDGSANARGGPTTAPQPRSAGRARAAVPIIEVVLRNGRVLRVAETISPDVLGRLAAALDA